MSAAQHIAFVTASTVGLPMVRRLLSAGHEVVAYSRTGQTVHGYIEAGAVGAAAAAEAAAAADVVIGHQLDDAGVQRMYLGTAGLLTRARPGQVFVEHGMFDPGLARTCARYAQQQGASFIDVPLSAPPSRAEKRQLIGFAGGSPELTASIRPILMAYCRDVVALGDVGCGLELALVHELLVSVHAVAAAEASALLSQLRLPPRESKRALIQGRAASTVLDELLPATLTSTSAVTHDTIQSAAVTRARITEAVARLGLRLQVYPAAQRHFTELVRAGAGRLDLSQLARAYEVNRRTSTDSAPPRSRAAVTRDSRTSEDPAPLPAPKESSS
ncbi:NAD(P)-binding domain-containing protein [Streptomyces sp. NPDC086777]|uniref:NAD(P)-binding domain-containing protein n=1 Tax=Streptomyces sp. NPDC086777 TaxID=3154866 RepID=UPI00344FBF4F